MLFRSKNFKMPSRRKVWVSVAVFVFLFPTILVATAFAGGTKYYHHLSDGLPEPTVEAMHSVPQSSKVYDRNGELLFEIYEEVRRREVDLEQIPKTLQEATIAIEDGDFYEHNGFDLSGIVRAFYVNLKNREIKQGASTITQQVARTIFLSREQSYTRKLKELILAIEIERRYSKDEILEFYLNNIPYGSNTYGVAAASEYYFNKPVTELTDQEAIYLAALPKAPTLLNPFGPNTDGLVDRARLVTESMYEKGFYTVYEKDEMIHNGKPEFVKSPVYIRAPHFVFYVLEGLEKEYGHDAIVGGGLEIITSLDLNLQREAESIIDKWGPVNEEKYRAGNASLVALNPKNGEVLAMVGSRNYFQAGFGAFNVATSPRQPGSSFKPYVYAAAINKGMNPNTILMDSRTNFAQHNYGVEYVPRNYDGKYHGAVTMRKALAGSLNIPAVKALVETGLGEVIDLAKEIGLNSFDGRTGLGPAVALGGVDISLLEHTAGLGVFANGGKKQEISPVLKIKNQNDRLIYEKKEASGEQVLNPHVAYWMNDMLSDARSRQYVFGARNLLDIPNRQVAAKTGTTQEYRDAWTVGYTPNLAVGVWAGNNDFSPMAGKAYGLAVAGPIWHDFMAKALTSLPSEKFARPPDLKDPPPPKYPTRVAISSEDEDDKEDKENKEPEIVVGWTDDAARRKRQEDAGEKKEAKTEERQGKRIQDEPGQKVEQPVPNEKNKKREALGESEKAEAKIERTRGEG